MDKMDYIASLAKQLEIPYSTYRKWFERGHVPYKWRDPIQALAIDQGRPLSKSDMVGLVRNRDRPPFIVTFVRERTP